MIFAAVYGFSLIFLVALIFVVFLTIIYFSKNKVLAELIICGFILFFTINFFYIWFPIKENTELKIGSYLLTTDYNATVPEVSFSLGNKGYLKKLNKKVYIHVDMIDGLNSTNNGIDYIVNTVKPDGILTTKSNVVAHAYKNNINVIQRFFILDSLSYEKALLNIKENKVVAVEIMPGLMPKIIKKLSQETHIPIITGGLIKEKEDVINAINAGALSVSTTEVKLWED